MRDQLFVVKPRPSKSPLKPQKQIPRHARNDNVRLSSQIPVEIFKHERPLPFRH
jgi:hypothetical protein